MKAAAFLRSDAARAVLERAAAAGSMPVSVHFVEGDREMPAIAGTGGCALCGYVGRQPDGEEACRKSRLKGSREALSRKRAAPFLCHMGFACVSVPALPEPELGMVLTMGPFCPSEAPESLVDDVRKGLEILGCATGPILPAPLSDVAFVSTRSAPVIAEWAAEKLAALWQAQREVEDAATGEFDGAEDHGRNAGSTGGAGGSRVRGRRGKSRALDTSPYRGAEIAAALAGGDQTLARRLVRSALSEVDRVGDVLSARRGRVIAVVGATLEAAQRARLDTADAWEEFPSFVAAARQARTESDLATAAVSLLAVVLRRSAGTPAQSALAEIERIVAARLPEPVLLNDVAKQLGRHPTAITHQLQRKFGLSFSQYVGRLRIDRAKELLRRTRLGVGEVARRVGIADGSNFSKLFRKFEGVSPQQYRTQYRSKR